MWTPHGQFTVGNRVFTLVLALDAEYYTTISGRYLIHSTFSITQTVIPSRDEVGLDATVPTVAYSCNENAKWSLY